MRKIAGVLAALLLLVGTASAAGATEYAQRGLQEEFNLALTPDEGPPGTTFSVAGGECDGGVVTVDTSRSTNASATPSEVEVTPGQDGTWSVDLTVDHGSVPYQSVVVDAVCEDQQSFRTFRRGDPSPKVLEYNSAYFEVLPDPTMTLTPMSGVAGSDFAVSGGTCADLYNSMAEVGDGTTDQTIEPDAEGDWDATFTVPDDAKVGDTITVQATCAGDGSDRVRGVRRGGRSTSFDYTPVVFTVTAEPATPSTPASPKPAPTGAVEAAAATPTTAQPTFTG